MDSPPHHQAQADPAQHPDKHANDMASIFLQMESSTTWLTVLDGKKAGAFQSQQSASGHDASSSRNHGGHVTCHGRWPQSQILNNQDLERTLRFW